MAELFLHGKVPPETKVDNAEFFQKPDRYGVLDLPPALLGVGFLKARDLKAAYGMYLLASWRTQLPLSRWLTSYGQKKPSLL